MQMPRTAVKLALVGAAVAAGAMLTPASATAVPEGNYVFTVRYFSPSTGEQVGERGCENWGVVTQYYMSMYVDCNSWGD
jgi:hypothetical protein